MGAGHITELVATLGSWRSILAAALRKLQNAPRSCPSGGHVFARSHLLWMKLSGVLTPPFSLPGLQAV